MRNLTLLAGTALVGVAFGLVASIPLAKGAPSPFIGLDEIHEGMHGYGLSVFKGTEPERFDVEVIGILHQFRPAEDLIIIKAGSFAGGSATSPGNQRVDVVKAVKGMSGSPIYFNDRLAGAYAWSFSSFGTEPVVGVTPINYMLQEMNRPIPPGFWPLEQPTGPLPAARPGPERHASVAPRMTPSTFDGPPGSYDLRAHAAQFADRLGTHVGGAMGQSVQPAGTALMMGGVSEHVAAKMRELFEPLGMDAIQAGGAPAGAAPSGPEHYANGGGLGVPLAKGDVSFAALGTATYVNGNKVAGFGHPFSNSGDSAMPACVARVLWVLSSSLHSFKIGECTRPLGALIQDRPTAIIVDEQKTAPMFPVDVHVQGVAGAIKNDWHVDIADEKFMSPGLVAAVVGSVVETTTSERRDLTWQLHTKVYVHGHGTLDLDDFGIAVGGTPDVPEWMQSRAVRAVGNVLNNPWELTRVDKIEATMDVQYTRDLWRLRGVELLDPIVDAGGKARIRMRLLPYAGQEIDRTIEVTMPSYLAGKDVELEIVPGYEVVPEQAAPEDLAALLANAANESYAPRSVVVQYKVGQQGLAFHGHVAPQLPSFALDALRPTTTDAAPDNFASYVRTTFPMDKYVEGRDKVRVHVREIVR